MRKNFWLGLSLINLCIVALFGFILRSKILFPLPWIDNRSILSAHSHFAFGGWVGLALMTLLIYNLLPAEIHNKKIYQWILGGIEVSSLGMAVFFPIQGYSSTAIIFSSFYIVFTYIFGWFFIKDAVKYCLKTVRLLAVAATASLLFSAIGPLGLSYILISGSTDSILYRDSIYTFLHFQYNGFFTLSIFALFFQHMYLKGMTSGKNMKRFSLMMVLSIFPSVFLALLWHNNALFYVLGALGCLLILLSLFFFFRSFNFMKSRNFFSLKLAYSLWMFSFLSFGLKMLLNAGTIIPRLSDAVYGDRPIIIGFLHLVFLGFVSFFILSHLLEERIYLINKTWAKLPIYIFSTGIFANEVFLMVQGLGILLKTNSGIYNWLLWIAAILLFTGALLIALTYLIQKSRRQNAAANSNII